jgi:hypothetical protein
MRASYASELTGFAGVVAIALIAGWVGESAGAMPPCTTDWRRVPTVDPGESSNLLIDVAFAGPGTGVAVGYGSTGGAARTPSAQGWDGAGFASLSLPDTSSFGTSPTLEGAGRAGSDLWIVGYVRTGYPTDQMPLVARVRDGGWDEVATPALRPQNTYPFAARGGFAHDAHGVSEDDLWVVGTAVGYGDASSTSVGLALHFDGSSWTDVPVPIVGNRTNALNCVSASAPDNVWAVGYWRDVAGPYRALIVRWDGSSWSGVPNPGETGGDGDAEAVLALAPDDVWVSGRFDNGASSLIHWNGSSWQTVNSGAPGVFAAFAATSASDIWASCALNATIYHYDGTSWAPAGGPVIAGSAYVLRGWGLAATGPCEVWSVGGWSDGVVQRTLGERLVPPCAADYNADGEDDILDFLDFFDDFGNCEGEPGPCGASGDADFNGDTLVDVLDFLDFFDAFGQGC